MSSSLVPVDFTNLPTQLGSDDDFNEMSESAEFLGRLQLYTKGKAVNKGLIRPGNFGIPESGDEVTDLGDSVDVIPFARKVKAIDMTDLEAIIVSHDRTSAEFQRIQEQSKERESHCMFGPSFLVFERSSGRFLEFFCGSKSARTESKKVYPFCPLSDADIARMAEQGTDVTGMTPHGPLPFTLKSRLAENKARGFSWHVPVVLKCSTPFANMPAAAVIHREIRRFLTTKDDGVEKVEDDQKSRAR